MRTESFDAVVPLTVRYERNPDGWITAQVVGFPAAVSQGQTKGEARAAVVDALCDLLSAATAEAAGP